MCAGDGPSKLSLGGGAECAECCEIRARAQGYFALPPAAGAVKKEMGAWEEGGDRG